MTKRQLIDVLDEFDDDEEIDFGEVDFVGYFRELEEAESERIEALEERQHATGFYAFQDKMAMMRFER